MSKVNAIYDYYQTLCIDAQDVKRFFRPNSVFVFVGDFDEHWMASGESEISHSLANSFRRNDGDRSSFTILIKQTQALSSSTKEIVLVKGIVKSRKSVQKLESKRNFMQLFILGKGMDMETGGHPNGHPGHWFKFCSMAYLAPTDAPSDIVHKPSLEDHVVTSDFKLRSFASVANSLRDFPCFANSAEEVTLATRGSQVVLHSNIVGALEPRSSTATGHVSLPELDSSGCPTYAHMTKLLQRQSQGKEFIPGGTSVNSDLEQEGDPTGFFSRNGYKYMTPKGKSENTLFVANIPLKVSPETFEEMFAIYGQIKSIKLIDREIYAFGFVHYADKLSVDYVLQLAGHSHSLVTYGIPLKVDRYKRKSASSHSHQIR